MTDDLHYDVYLPEDVKSVDITTIGELSEAQVQYKAAAPNRDLDYSKVVNGVYPDFVLADKSGTDTAVVQLKAGGNEGLQYTLRIHRLSKAEDPMVYVNANHVKKEKMPGVQGIYRYKVDKMADSEIGRAHV